MELPQDYTKLDWRQKRMVREEYSFRQDGKCCHCGCDLQVRPKQDKRINWRLFPNNFLKYPVHLHHDHKTGMTIGAVHSYCNAVLWQYYGE